MNAFQQLVQRLNDNDNECMLHVNRPAHADGQWFATLVADDGYIVEIQWNRHLGFGISAGRNLEFGTGADEAYGSVDNTFFRITNLIEDRAETETGAVSISDLRRLSGVLQKDAAHQIGMTKSGLNQIEREDLATLRISTLKKFVEGLGAELVVLARFKKGHEREIELDLEHQEAI